MTNAILLSHTPTKEITTPAIRVIPPSKKAERKPVKSKVIIVPYYPPVLMPEQPSGYLKPRKYDFF